MTNLHRGPPKETAAGKSTDGRSGFAPKAKRRVTEGYQKPQVKSSGSGARHEYFIRQITAALKAGDTGLWVRATQAAKELLTEEERASWAFAGLRSLEPDMREITVEHAWLDAHRPPPLLDEDVMAEARLRAAASTRRERKAALAANFEASITEDRVAFIAWARGTKK